MRKEVAEDQGDDVDEVVDDDDVTCQCIHQFFDDFDFFDFFWRTNKSEELFFIFGTLPVDLVDSYVYILLV